MTNLALEPATRLSPTDFRQLMSCWCTGVAVVTSASGRAAVGCTVNAITSVSLEPPLLLIGLAAQSRTLAVIQQERRLGISLLSAQQVSLARQFAQGEPAERFAGVACQWTDGIPLLSDAVVATVCVTERLLPVADHLLVVAQPVWWGRMSRHRPLVSYGSSYWSLWSMAVVGGK